MDNTRSSLRQPGAATEWTARGLQGKPMVPPASPMESMARTLRSPPQGPAPTSSVPTAPTYRPPAVNPSTGEYVGRGAPKAAASVPAPTVTAPAAPVTRAARLRSVAGAGARMAGGLAAGAGVVGSFGDYKIDDPEVDSSLGGSIKTLASGDLRGFASGVSKGALETGMDLGSAGAKALDFFRPGTSKQYDTMLRNQFGTQLIGPDRGTADPGAPADAAPTRPTPQAQPAVPAASMPPAALRDQPSIRRVDGGSSPLFTNLAEDSTDNAALMGRGAVSPQNMAAADALSARYAAERAGERAMEQAAPAQTDQGLRGGLFDTPKARRAARALDISERNATRSDNTTRRGQDMELEGRMAPIRQAGMLRQMKAQVMNAAGGDYGRAARIWAAQGGDPKDFLDAQSSVDASATSDQNRFTKARENTVKEFTVFGADNKQDEKASAESFDAVRQIFPGIESADEATRNSAMADAKEMQAIFVKARNQDKVGWDALKFWEPARPALRSMPNARGGQTETLSGIGGMTTIGAGNGDTLLTLNGKTLNLGKLNERQLELLERAKAKGWGQ